MLYVKLNEKSLAAIQIHLTVDLKQDEQHTTPVLAYFRDKITPMSEKRDYPSFASFQESLCPAIIFSDEVMAVINQLTLLIQQDKKGVFYCEANALDLLLKKKLDTTLVDAYQPTLLAPYSRFHRTLDDAGLGVSVKRDLDDPFRDMCCTM